MRTNLLWKASQYPSLENCLVTDTQSGWDISSTITGGEQGRIFNIEYQLCVNKQWFTKSIRIISTIDGVTETFNYLSDQRGNWQADGTSTDLFAGCFDVDLPLTPFTNTLPINRLQLRLNQSQIIRVVYLDLIGGEIKPVTQKYTRLSEYSYKYENVPNDFEANVSVDEFGFVTDYPGLFERIAIRTEAK